MAKKILDKKPSGVAVKGSSKAVKQKDFDIDCASLKQCREKLAEQNKLIRRQKTEITKLEKTLAAEKITTEQQSEDIEYLNSELDRLMERFLIMNSKIL